MQSLPLGSWGASVLRRVLCFLALFGPGIIAATADNDASGIFGYSLAGAQFKYGLLWILLFTTVALGIAQEIGARMGARTGKGLGTLIRERYDPKVSFFVMAGLCVANLATTVAEFAGMLAATSVFLGPASRFWVLPLTALSLYWVALGGNYKRMERTMLCASAVYLVYVVSALLAKPDWSAVAASTVMPNMGCGKDLPLYVFMIVNLIGTTITPWGQFYIQSAVRDKGVGMQGYKSVRLDVYLGAFFTNLIAFFIVVCCGATMAGHAAGTIIDVGQLARAFLPLAGTFSALIFAFGLYNASCFGAVAVPMSTAYAVTEALGYNTGVGKTGAGSRLFKVVYAGMIAFSALVVILFPTNLALLMVLPNIIGALLLPVILVLMLLLVNDRGLMGEHVNGPVLNALSWGTVAVVTLLSVVLLVFTIHL